MITIILMLLTWYLTKVYYTRDLFINLPELEDHGLMTARCARCSQFIVIDQEHMRNPFYCNVCK
jgi:exosome complex RNA-binding protein Csl4